MKVFVDDQIFCAQSDGGISRYFVELMRAFRSDASLGIELTGSKMWTKNRYLIESGMGRRLPSPLGRSGKILWIANRFRRPRGPVDVVHHTYYFRPSLGHIPRTRCASLP